MCYGGFIPGYPDDRKGTGSTRFMYSLLIGAEGEQMKVFPKFPFSQQVNASDVAKAHVKALEIPPLPASDGRRKRFIISQGCYTYVEAIRLLKKERPELAWRLPDENDPAGTKQSKKVFDTSLAAEILGMKQADYVGPEKTLLDTIDQLVTWEKATGQSPQA
jgi:nucleoside-diphosphate-sugar epimerase